MLQAAEAVGAGAADVGSPEGNAEGNIEGLGPVVAPGQNRRNARKAKAGKMPPKPGGPSYKCLATGIPASH